jgi:hypothetical protein
VLARVARLLATILVLVFAWIFWAGERARRPSMPHRGDLGPSWVCWVARRGAHSAAVRAGSRACWARA